VLAPPPTSSIPSSTVQRLPMSYEAYLQFATENQLIEWTAGETLIMPPPSLQHQTLLLFLVDILREFIRVQQLGQLLVAPFSVQLWPGGPAREPDILFIAHEQLGQLGERGFKGAPRLVVEIISPSSVVEDRQRKFGEYEQAGVQEYWLVDARPFQEQAEFFRLDDTGAYQAVALDEAGRFHSETLPHFWLDVRWLTTKPLPNPQRQAAAILGSVPTLAEPLRQAYQLLYEALPD
jgi:Uma2 family endonuclease